MHDREHQHDRGPGRRHPCRLRPEYACSGELSRQGGKAARIAEQVLQQANNARAQFESLDFPLPDHTALRLQCRTLAGERPVTPGSDVIEFQVRDFRDAFLEGVRLPGAQLSPGAWDDLDASWRDTVNHEVFHTIQYRLVSTFAPDLWLNYFNLGNSSALEGTAALSQDLFPDVDDGSAAPRGSYVFLTDEFLRLKPTIESFAADDAAYEAAPVIQYWGERFGAPAQTLEHQVSGFMRELVVANGIRTEAMQNAIGSDVYPALRDFYVTGHVHRQSDQPGPYAILDEITSHAAAPGVGNGTAFDQITAVPGDISSGPAVWQAQQLGQGRGEVYSIPIPPGTTSVEVGLQTRPTGGIDIFGTKLLQNWSPLRTAFVVTDASGSSIVDPALMPDGPNPADGLVEYIVDVRGKARLGVILVAGEDLADYDLTVQTAGIATASIVAPTTAGPRVIGAGADPEDFEIAVDLTLDGAPPTAVQTGSFNVTVGTASATVKSVLPTLPGRFKLLVEPPAGLADGRHTLAVDFFGGTDSETDAIIVGEAPRAAVSLVIDKSGSMGGARIVAAKAAAVQFVEQMELNDYVALVTFDGSAYVNKPMTLLTNEVVRQQVIDAINAITAGGSTNIAAGLAAGNEQLAGAGGTGASRAILLLTDGLDSSNVDAVIAQIPADVDAHTVALDAGSDQAKLQHIADATGGVFLFAPSPAELANLYSLIRARITHTELRQLSLGVLAQGQSTEASFPVAPGASTASVGIAWAGSDFDLSLELPSGRIITETTQAGDVVVRSGANFATIEVSSPEPGGWQATIFGASVPAPEEVTLRVEEQGSSVASSLDLEALGDAGAPIAARLAVTGADGPIGPATVLATVRRPDGSTAAVPLVDDGGHHDGYPGDGVFGAVFSSTRQSGSYTVTVEATGTDGGFEFARQEVASIFLAPGTDTDSDGITDETEARLGLDANDPADAVGDLDGDGLGTLAELDSESDPLLRDTDGGGEMDGTEAAGGRSLVDPADDIDLPDVYARVVVDDGRMFVIHAMTSSSSGSVHIQRVGPAGITDLGVHPGAGVSLSDGPLAADAYTYLVSTVVGGAESPPTVLGPFDAVDDATPPELTAVMNDGIWETAQSFVTVDLSVSEPVVDMRYAPTREGLDIAAWQPFSAQFSYDVGGAPGVKRLYVEVRDATGNVSYPSVASVEFVPSVVTTTRVSESTTHGQGNGVSDDSYISADGRFVTYRSTSSNLVTGDTNGVMDVFVHDRLTETTSRASLDASGVEGNAQSDDSAISADGRYVVFRSQASNFVTGDTNGTAWDIFRKDLQTGAIVRVSTSSAGAQSNGASHDPVVSADGRYVAFRSSATNLVTGDTNGQQDIFRKDLVTGTTTLVSVSSGGVQGNALSDDPQISDNGSRIAFHSDATNLVSADTNAARDVFVRDVSAGTTVRVSLSSSGSQGNGASAEASISGDGTTVAFQSDASNLVAGDTNAKTDVFVGVLATGVTSRVSVSASGTQQTKASEEPSLSSDGSIIAFDSLGSSLVSGDTNSRKDIFIKDLDTGEVSRMSVDTAEVQGNDTSRNASLSGDGTTVAFESDSTNLVANDTNATQDVFVRGPSLAQ